MRLALRAWLAKFMDKLPSSGIIVEALRKEDKIYPKVAIGKLVANALVHQGGLEPVPKPLGDRDREAC